MQSNAVAKYAPINNLLKDFGFQRRLLLENKKYTPEKLARIYNLGIKDVNTLLNLGKKHFAEELKSSTVKDLSRKYGIKKSEITRWGKESITEEKEEEKVVFYNAAPAEDKKEQTVPKDDKEDIPPIDLSNIEFYKYIGRISKEKTTGSIAEELGCCNASVRNYVRTAEYVLDPDLHAYCINISKYADTEGTAAAAKKYNISPHIIYIIQKAAQVIKNNFPESYENEKEVKSENTSDKDVQDSHDDVELQASSPKSSSGKDTNYILQIEKELLNSKVTAFIKRGSFMPSDYAKAVESIKGEKTIPMIFSREKEIYGLVSEEGYGKFLTDNEFRSGIVYLAETTEEGTFVYEKEYVHVE